MSTGITFSSRRSFNNRTSVLKSMSQSFLLMELITEAINLAISEIVEAEQTPPRNEEER
ncbi:unnamed protein product [Brassica rapa subsp. trilocularis]